MRKGCFCIRSLFLLLAVQKTEISNQVCLRVGSECAASLIPSVTAKFNFTPSRLVAAKQINRAAEQKSFSGYGAVILKNKT